MGLILPICDTSIEEILYDIHRSDFVLMGEMHGLYKAFGAFSKEDGAKFMKHFDKK